MKSDTSDGGAPQKRPGVDHNYHDYSKLTASELSTLFPAALRQQNPMASGAMQQGFAVKPHYMLGDVEARGESGVVSWQPHGR